MPRVIRFHLDENVDHSVAFGLRLRGVDVTTSTDAGLVSASDADQLHFAMRQKRVLFTHDSDFLDPSLASQGHSGIVYCSKDSRTIGQIVRFLMLVHECVKPEELEGEVEFC